MFRPRPSGGRVLSAIVPFSNQVKLIPMNKGMKMFLLALFLLVLVTATILAFVAAPANPLTWLLAAVLVATPLVYRKLAAGKYIEWKHEYNTGIDSIDQQHRKLVGLINQLQSAVDYSTGAEFEREALNGVVEYTRTHFAYEEQLMRENGFPGYEAHKKEHERMIQQVNDALAEYEHNKENAMQAAHDFLGDWLINHINGTDKGYCEFLIGKGVR